MVALSQHYVSLDQDRGAQIVEDREKERARNETSTADATDNSTTDLTPPNAPMGATKRRKHAITSTARNAKPLTVFSGPPGPLPSVLGTILSGR
jgi:hypothetical protein